MPTLRHLVGIIGNSITQKEVIRIYTTSIIATMKNPRTRRNWSLVHFPGNAVRFVYATLGVSPPPTLIVGKSPVTITVLCASPFPALCSALCTSIEAITPKWQIVESHSVLHIRIAGQRHGAPARTPCLVAYYLGWAPGPPGAIGCVGFSEASTTMYFQPIPGIHASTMNLPTAFGGGQIVPGV